MVAKAQQTNPAVVVLLLNQFISESIQSYCVGALQKLRAKYIVYPRPAEIVPEEALATTRNDVLARIASLLNGYSVQQSKFVCEPDNDAGQPKLAIALLGSTDTSYQQSFRALW